MPIAIIFFQGIYEIFGLVSFLMGYFMEIRWLMTIGGCVVVIDDILEIKMGILKPIFPILLATFLALFFTPWYVGVFWASAAFKVLGIPSSLIKIISPKRILAKANRKV